MSKHKKYLLFISFMFGILFNLGNPTIPLYLDELNIGGVFFGLFLSTTGIGLFLFSTLWGAIGDIKDRNIVLSVTFYGFGIGQILFGVFANQYLLFLAAMITGVFTSGVLVNIYSYINDNFHDEQTRNKNLSYAVSLTLLASAISYLLGGYMVQVFENNYNFVFFIQGIASVAFATYIYFEKTDLIDTDHHLTRVHFITNMKYILKFPWLPLVTITLTFFISFSQNNIRRFFDYFFINRGFEPSTLGWIVFVTGLVCLVTNLWVTPWILRKTHNLAILVIIFIIAPLMLLITFYKEISILKFFTVFMIYHIVMAIYEPTAISLISNNKAIPQGVLVGVRQSVVGLGMTIGFIVGGALYEINDLYVFYFAIIFYIIVLVGFIIISIILNKEIRDYKGG